MAVEVKYPNLIYNSFQKGESRMNLIHCDIDYINVVIIFDREVKDCVAPVKIKEILGTEGDVISLPDILLAEKKDLGFQVQIRENTMTMSIRDIDIDDNDISSKIKILSSLVVSLFNIVRETTQNAHGFNYSGKCEADIEVTADEFFRDVFLPFWKDLSNTLGGTITRFRPSFSLERESVRYNINLLPIIKERSFSFSCNAHFEKPFQFCSAQALETDLKKQFECFIDILRNM